MCVCVFCTRFARTSNELILSIISFSSYCERMNDGHCYSAFSHSGAGCQASVMSTRHNRSWRRSAASMQVSDGWVQAL